MSRSTDTAMAFLLGAVAGGAIALLMAPDKGSETRRRIRSGATGLAGRGKDYLGEKTGAVRERAGDVVERTREKVSEVKEGARGQLDAVKSAVAEGKETYRREMERGQSPTP